jgi:hypothetical protein
MPARTTLRTWGAALAVTSLLGAGVAAGAAPASAQETCRPIGAIGHYWASVGGPSSHLGSCVTSEAPVPGGVAQKFSRGSVYWSPATGARSVRGDIARVYDAVGASSSRLRLPTTSERATPRRHGAYNHFQGGSLYWSPTTGTHLIAGAIFSKWGAQGWENGSLGFPTSSEAPTARPGAFSNFQGGSIYWSPTTGPRTVRGAIRTTWLAQGGVGGALGFPTTDELSTPGRTGAYTHFQGGSVYWSPTTGAHSVVGAIRARWAALGWEGSALGFPTSSEYAAPTGRAVNFENGKITWNAGTQALTVDVKTPPVPRYNATQPIRAAFYYGWYPSSFNIPGTRFRPIAGKYNTQDLNTVRRQVNEMRYGGMQAAIASWWGPETVPDPYRDWAASSTDRSLRVGLKAAEGTPFTWGIYYEDEGYSNPSVTTIRNDLAHVKRVHASHPNFLYRNGKPVVFVWPSGSDTCEMVHRWKQAAPDFFVVHKRFNGWENCRTVPDSWHQYAPASRDSALPGYSYSVSPGFHQYNGGVRLSRDANAFSAAVGRMKASNATWQLVTTYNEWGEGTSVEPAHEWASGSGFGWPLDTLNRHYGRY